MTFFCFLESATHLEMSSLACGISTLSSFMNALVVFAVVEPLFVFCLRVAVCHIIVRRRGCLSAVVFLPYKHPYLVPD